MILNKSIDMIAYTDKKGNMQPQRFRFSDDTDQLIVINVGKILYVENKGDKKNPVKSFTCQSAIDDYMRQYELQYHYNASKWILYRM